ncbi:MAG: MFS transporter [Halioglobus sp.]
MIGVLLLAYTFSFIDRQILSLLVEPMKRDLSISDTQMSLLQGISFAIFYTFLGLPLGRLSDLRSRRGLIACGIFLWSVMTALCGVAKTYSFLFLARMGVGVGEAALSPAAYSLIADSVEEKHLAKSIAVYTMGIYLGGGLALIVGGVVVDWAESLNTIVLPILGEVYSWQLVFLAVGLPGLLLVPLMFTIAEPSRKVSTASAKNSDIKSVIAFFKDNKRTILFSNFGAAFAALAGYGALAWVPTYLMRTYQMSASEVGLAFGLIVLFGGSLGVMSGGWIADKWYGNGQRDAKLRVAMLAGILGLVPTALYPMATDLYLTLLLLAVSTYFTNFMMGLGPAAIQEVVPNQMRGQFSALYLFIVNLVGLGIGPTAVALCTDYLFHDSGVAYSLALVPTCALAISAFFLWRCMPHYRKSLASLDNEL